MNYEAQLAAYRTKCEAAIQQGIDAYFLPESKVSQAAAYTLANGGKRIRGVLVLAVCDMLSGNADMASIFAVAIEMVHAFSLIHDDLPCMDDDDMRRGKPSAHIVFGEATALLAGDLLSLCAFEAIAAAPFPKDKDRLLAAVHTLAAAAGAKGMLYGQELDLYYETRSAGADALHEIHRHKTGALIMAAAQLGAIAAGYAPKEAPAITQYARDIGLVFQILDDILDVTSTDAALGKPVGSDAGSQKSTFVSLYGLEEAQNRAAQLTRSALDVLQEAYGENAQFLCRFAQALAQRLN